jgi:maltose alpha-D-glucosyltransferase/alpha-amylase
VLVVANLSRFVQYVELDLSRYKGLAPIELFSHSPFPSIGDLPYLLTLGPHGFLWFSIEQPRNKEAADLHEYRTPLINLRAASEGVLRVQARAALSTVLPDYLPRCRWFRSKSRRIRSARIDDAMTLTEGESALELAFVRVEYTIGEPEIYVLPLGLALGEEAGEVRAKYAQHIIADVRVGNTDSEDGVLFDATASPQFGLTMLGMIRHDHRTRTPGNKFLAYQTTRFHDIGGNGAIPEPRLLKAEQSNTSIVFGDRAIMKLFRKLEPGLNPDIEVGRFLAELGHFANSPPLAGWIDYKMGRSDVRNLALLQEFVPNQGDAWQFTAAELERYFEVAATRTAGPPLPKKDVVELVKEAEPDPIASDMIGAYLHSAGLMGQRVAELHLAFLTSNGDPDFTPERISPMYQRSRYQSMRNLLGQVLRLLNSRLNALPKDQRKCAQTLLNQRNRLDALFDAFLKRRFDVVRTRAHGDLHLGQMLFTGKDFLIIDFEGEPARPLEERRRKRSPLRDVAGMLRSFDYAAFSELTHQVQLGALGNANFDTLEPWARFWRTWSSWAFMRGYLETSASAAYLPKDPDELRDLLDALVLEKAVYELGYELDNRPDWVFIPLHGIAQMVGLGQNAEK